ncbi:MAG TPA: hypothetical protein VGH16_18375 [Candidatus Binatia bacterium]|jgi:hypothetical protein
MARGFASSLFAAALFLVAVPVFAQGQSLIGHWDGTIEGLPGSENPARILRVHSVNGDKAIVVWATPGGNATQTEASAAGGTLKIAFPAAKTSIELTQAGDELAGTLTGASGKAYPIKFKRAKLSTELDGDWEGRAVNNPRNPKNCTDGNYFVTIKESLIVGTFRVVSRADNGILEAAVTGEVQPDKTAAIEYRATTPMMGSARFTGSFSGNEFHGKDAGSGRLCTYDVSMKKH